MSQAYSERRVYTVKGRDRCLHEGLGSASWGALGEPVERQRAKEVGLD